jgi:hypothetical protein
VTDQEILQRFAARIRNDVIKATLEEEQQLQCSVVSHGKAAFAEANIGDLLFGRNPHASEPGATCSYWRETQSSIVELFGPALAIGDQPVFASISLLTTSTGYTVFVPVPYREAHRDMEGMKNALWLNPEQGECRQYKAAQVEPAARAVSHALANISYSVWIQDNPNSGWLALAHASPDPIYIPDVRTLHGAESGDARTKATSEEPHLGMASVLYVPLCDFSPSQQKPAPAVLMLWSPVPGRWDGRFPDSVSIPSRAGQTQAWRLRTGLGGNASGALWREFQWTEHVAARDHANYGRTELQVMNLLLAWIHWQGKQQGVVQKAVQEFLHGIDEPILSLASEQETATVSVRDWLCDIFKDRRGFVNSVLSGHPDLSKVIVTLRTPQDHKQTLAFADAYESIDRLADLIPPSLIIPLDRATARNLAADPASNIVRHAQSLDAIEITVSNRYATVDYRETPSKDARKMLMGSDGFLNYFAIRRGLPVTPAIGDARGDGTGVGLWISRLLEARRRSVSRLYVSADLRQWTTTVVMAVDGGETLGEHVRD